MTISRVWRRPAMLVVLAIALSALASLYAVSFLGDIHSASSAHSRPPHSPSPSTSANTAPPLAPHHTAGNAAGHGPPISIVIIWKNGHAPYVPNFVESVLANAGALEVLWVGVMWAHETECYDPLEGHGARVGANLRLLCLSEDEYWGMHRDYFCERWDCSAQERQQVLDVMKDRSTGDYQHSFFRLWRGYVFREHINPGAQWWGWADPDTFLGSFRTQFPWDATDFDLVIPASPHTLLYLRGHLCFFRMGARTEWELNEYPNLMSMRSYLLYHTTGVISSAMEEAEFSAFITRTPSITFLLIDSHLVEVPLHQTALNTPTFATLNGTYTLSPPSLAANALPPFPEMPVLGLPGQCAACPARAPRAHTFTAAGVTRPVELRIAQYPSPVWFDEKYATHYDRPRRTAVQEQQGWVTYVGRGGPWAGEGGREGVWERIEPPAEGVDVSGVSGRDGEGETRTVLREGLYIHWFHEKHGDWFPGPRIRPGQTLMSVFKDGAEMWAGGEVIWRGARGA